MDYQPLIEQFNTQIKTIESEHGSPLEKSQRIILIARELLAHLKKEVRKNSFPNEECEIQFFKYIKHIPLSNLIYYSELMNLEIHMPKVGIEEQANFIKKKYTILNRFFRHNAEFVTYIECNYQYLDKYYFTRNERLHSPLYLLKHYQSDPEFTTPMEYKYAQYIAKRRLINYFNGKVLDKNSNQVKKNLEWTASKTALTELIYALYHGRAINNGQSDIKEIAAALEGLFNFDLGDFYKIFAEIKSRKLSRTRFLDNLSTGLQNFMLNSEE